MKHWKGALFALGLTLARGGGAQAQAQPPPLSAREARALGGRLQALGSDRQRLEALFALGARRVDARSVAALAQRVTAPCARLRAALFLCSRARGAGRVARAALAAALAPAERARFQSLASACGEAPPSPGLGGLAQGNAQELRALAALAGDSAPPPLGMGIAGDQCLCNDECEVRFTDCCRSPYATLFWTPAQPPSGACGCALDPRAFAPSPPVCQASQCVLASPGGLVGGGGGAQELRPQLRVRFLSAEGLSPHQRGTFYSRTQSVLVRLYRENAPAFEGMGDDFECALTVDAKGSVREVQGTPALSPALRSALLERLRALGEVPEAPGQVRFRVTLLR